MSAQPEALRLADELRAAPERSRTSFEAAVELRRLHAQRDALLEALAALVLNIDAGGASLDAMRDARAAIKAVEGEKT